MILMIAFMYKDNTSPCTATQPQSRWKAKGDKERTIVSDDHFSFTRLALIMSTAWFGVFIRAALNHHRHHVRPHIKRIQVVQPSVLSRYSIYGLHCRQPTHLLSPQTHLWSRAGPYPGQRNLLNRESPLRSSRQPGNNHIWLANRWSRRRWVYEHTNLPRLRPCPPSQPSYGRRNRESLVWSRSHGWCCHGGVVNDYTHLSWRMAFLTQVPPSILSAIFVHFLVRVPPKQSDKSYLKRIDFGGVLVGIQGTAASNIRLAPYAPHSSRLVSSQRLLRWGSFNKPILNP